MSDLRAEARRGDPLGSASGGDHPARARALQRLAVAPPPDRELRPRTRAARVSARPGSPFCSVALYRREMCRDRGAGDRGGRP
jgi:hypothetical protein